MPGAHAGAPLLICKEVWTVKLNPKQYDEMVNRASPPSPVVQDCVWAFLVGGAICTLGEGLRQFFLIWYDKTLAGTLTSIALIFLSALQKIDSALYEAAKIDGGSQWECFWKITLPTIKPMILLNAVYSVIFLSGNEQNSLINMIESAMFSGTKEKGYGYASAMAWMYAVIVTLIVLLFFLLLGSKKDIYDRQVKRHKREMKKEARTVKRIERRGERNARKIERTRKKRNYRTYDGSGDY